MSQTIEYKVIGQETIHCEACEQRVGKALRRLRGVEDVRASSETQQVQVTIDLAQVSAQQVQARLEQIGYHVAPEEAPE